MVFIQIILEAQGLILDYFQLLVLKLNYSSPPMKEALGQGCTLQSQVEVSWSYELHVFATGKVLATLHALSVLAEVQEKA